MKNAPNLKKQPADLMEESIIFAGADAWTFAKAWQEMNPIGDTVPPVVLDKKQLAELENIRIVDDGRLYARVCRGGHLTERQITILATKLAVAGVERAQFYSEGYQLLEDWTPQLPRLKADAEAGKSMVIGKPLTDVNLRDLADNEKALILAARYTGIAINENSEGVKEIENDINRLKTISERFSKIGSVPELNDLNINETLQQNYDYLKSRISKKVKFMLVLPQQEILIPHNRILLSWVIENIVKNAVDAMKGEGRLEINLYEKNKNVLIDFKDTGSGMTNFQARNAFKAGYSTKKRGWGLGLSLAKRVIKEYHKGDIKIAHTAVGEGSTFRILMKNG